MKKLSTLLCAAALAISASAATTPSFPGGQEALDSFLIENMIYPDTPKANGIEGIVEVGFTVNTDGSLSNIRIMRMLDPDLEAEAIRLVKKMPKWTPADINGSPKAANTRIKVTFTLE